MIFADRKRGLLVLFSGNRSLDNGAYVPLDYVLCKSRVFAVNARSYHQKVE
jgi:hypothetical protein